MGGVMIYVSILSILFTFIIASCALYDSIGYSDVGVLDYDPSPSGELIIKNNGNSKAKNVQLITGTVEAIEKCYDSDGPLFSCKDVEKMSDFKIRSPQLSVSGLSSGQRYSIPPKKLHLDLDWKKKQVFVLRWRDTGFWYYLSYIPRISNLQDNRVKGDYHEHPMSAKVD